MTFIRSRKTGFGPESSLINNKLQEGGDQGLAGRKACNGVQSPFQPFTSTAASWRLGKEMRRGLKPAHRAPRTIHFWGAMANPFSNYAETSGVIRIRPGGYKTPNTFRMCHPLFKPSCPTTASYDQETILWSTVLGPLLCKWGNWNSAKVACLMSYMYKWPIYEQNLDLLT